MCVCARARTHKFGAFTRMILFTCKYHVAACVRVYICVRVCRQAHITPSVVCLEASRKRL